MAGNKIQKTKGKDKTIGNKSKGENNLAADGPDHALLRKPILTSITGFSQAVKIYDSATEELKHLLSNECDVLYECRVCRNLFRSLANFISHKRVYCKEQFNHIDHGHFMKTTEINNELSKIKRLEAEYQENLKVNVAGNTVVGENDERIPLTQDLTEIVDKLSNKNGLHNSNSDDTEPQIILQEIANSSVAVFQHLNTNEEENVESIQKQVDELDNMMAGRVGFFQQDGNCKTKVLTEDSNNVIQISDDEDGQNENTSDALKCKMCDLQFSTQKTLKFHMKYKHVESRLVYPCPDCLEIFSTSWSVYRHLFKVHRKTAAQIRRLRESIQAKAFRMNNIPAFYEKRRNNAKQAATRRITEEERLDQENQAWMENMESDAAGPRCGGCGRAFERRAALVAHTHTCAPRHRARLLTKHAKRIQIQIRRDYHKGPPRDRHEHKIPEEVSPVPEPAKNDANVSQVVDDDADEVELEDDDKTEGTEDEASKSPENAEVTPQKSPSSASGDVLMVRDDTSPEHTNMMWDDRAEEESPVPPDVALIQNTLLPVIRLPHAKNAEESNLNVFKQKIQRDIEEEALLCKKCENKFDTVKQLYEHVAAHYKWMRYACKLCNFKHYAFEKLPEHVKVVHRLKGDKDFYFSTVKALDGPEALELAENMGAPDTVNENSPDSQRSSRCSSDSSRLSDDGSPSSSQIVSGAKKRKIQQTKTFSKRKKELPCKITQDQCNDNQGTPPAKEVSLVETNNSSNIKAIEENSSDMDDLDDKAAKRQLVEDTPSMASRRPVRRKTKPKNEDFEYDLSNLLKMEAQGYRDSQTSSNAKSNNTKKKSMQENQSNYENWNKDCSGAMLILSKKAVEKSAAHMKMTSCSIYSAVREHRNSNLFVRPMLPKSLNKGDKISPKKDSPEDKKDNSSSPNKELQNQKPSEDFSKKTSNEIIDSASKDKDNGSDLNKDNNKKTEGQVIKTNISNTAVLPFKIGCQKLGVIKNTVISNQVKAFPKPKINSKILVLKPFKRGPEGLKGSNTPIQYQTITVKDSNKNPLCEDKPSYHQLVVEMPVVENAVAHTSADTIIRKVTSPVTSDTSKESTAKTVNDSCVFVKRISVSSDVIEKKHDDNTIASINKNCLNNQFQKDVS